MLITAAANEGLAWRRGGERVGDAPDGGLGEASVRLALAEDVEVAAGAELGEEAGPAVPFRDAVEAGQERVVDGLQDLALRAGAALLVAALQLRAGVCPSPCPPPWRRRWVA